jgi:transposase InsO family protein
MTEAVREALLEVRGRHPSWGPRKILAWFEARHSRTTWPASSSVGELRRREGLVAQRRKRSHREPHPGAPLTVLHHASRMCLAIDGLGGTDGERAGRVFQRAFREVGLPQAISSDNGPPFVASRGLKGLTKLSVGWLELGIRPLRTEPASPEQNGAHERFHRTLEAETGKPPASASR